MSQASILQSLPRIVKDYFLQHTIFVVCIRSTGRREILGRGLWWGFKMAGDRHLFPATRSCVRGRTEERGGGECGFKRRETDKEDEKDMELGVSEQEPTEAVTDPRKQ